MTNSWCVPSTARALYIGCVWFIYPVLSLFCNLLHTYNFKKLCSPKTCANLTLKSGVDLASKCTSTWVERLIYMTVVDSLQVILSLAVTVGSLVFLCRLLYEYRWRNPRPMEECDSLGGEEKQLQVKVYHSLSDEGKHVTVGQLVRWSCQSAVCFLAGLGPLVLAVLVLFDVTRGLWTVEQIGQAAGWEAVRLGDYIDSFCTSHIILHFDIMVTVLYVYLVLSGLSLQLFNVFSARCI